MPIPAEQAEIAAFLAARAGAPPIETHISLVFLAPHAAWKLHKAVRLSFLDFSTPTARRRDSRAELARGRRFAPGLYRDVGPVIRRADGALGFGTARTDPARALDWVLHMARVPAADFLDRRARDGALTPALLSRLADAVAAAHAGCPIRRDDPDLAGGRGGGDTGLARSGASARGSVGTNRGTGYTNPPQPEPRDVRPTSPPQTRHRDRHPLRRAARQAGSGRPRGLRRGGDF